LGKRKGWGAFIRKKDEWGKKKKRLLQLEKEFTRAGKGNIAVGKPGEKGSNSPIGPKGFP